MLQTILSRFAFLAFGVAPMPMEAQDRAQDPNFHGWYMYFGDHPIKKTPWGVHLEAQWRRHDVTNKWQQSFFRPAVNYAVSPNLSVTAGVAFADTFRYGEFPVTERFPEFRVFQQALLTHASGRVDFAHRYRLEQRYLGEVSRSPEGDKQLERWRYENRFRYQFRFTVPLKAEEIDPGGVYVALYNEFFVNFGKNVGANVFDQNRAYAALGFALNKHNRLETGYLHQLVQQRNGRVFEHNHTLQVGWFSTLPFGREN
jgi:hypothetical protein